MELMNCPKCGKIFSRVNSPICDECVKKEEDLFERVKKYLNDNPNCSIEELSKETGASAKKILRYIREGRLEISKGMSLRCESCGKPITIGRYCDACIIEINQQVSDMIEQSRKTGIVMHTKSHKEENKKRKP